MHYSYKNIADGEWLKLTTAFTSHLYKQQNLIAEMQSRCPKITTQWTAMGNICKWQLDKRIRLLQYIKDTSPVQAPPLWWWIVVATIHTLSQSLDIVITKLQAKDLLISQQTAILKDLPTQFCTEIGIEGPFNEAYINRIDKIHNSTYGSWSISHLNISLFLQDQGMAVQQLLNTLGYEGSHKVINIIGTHIVHIVDGIFKIQAECNSANDPSDCYTIPPVLPHELVKLCGAAFTAIVVKHLPQLENFWSATQIEHLESQHRELRFEYQQSSTFAEAIDACDHTTSFM